MTASENFLQVSSLIILTLKMRKLWHREHSGFKSLNNYNANLHMGEVNGVMNEKMHKSFPKPHSMLNSVSNMCSHSNLTCSYRQ